METTTPLLCELCQGPFGWIDRFILQHPSLIFDTLPSNCTHILQRWCKRCCKQKGHHLPPVKRRIDGGYDKKECSHIKQKVENDEIKNMCFSTPGSSEVDKLLSESTKNFYIRRKSQPYDVISGNFILHSICVKCERNRAKEYHLNTRIPIDDNHADRVRHTRELKYGSNEKACYKCKTIKPLEEFYPRSGSKNPKLCRTHECKNCIKLKQNNYRKRRIERQDQQWAGYECCIAKRPRRECSEEEKFICSACKKMMDKSLQFAGDSTLCIPCVHVRANNRRHNREQKQRESSSIVLQGPWTCKYCEESIIDSTKMRPDKKAKGGFRKSQCYNCFKKSLK